MTVKVYSADILVKNLSENHIEKSIQRLNSNFNYTTLSMNDVDGDNNAQIKALIMYNTFYRVTINSVTVRFYHLMFILKS